MLFTKEPFAKTWVVAPNTALSNLRQAVKLAHNGDSILVKKGTYSSVNTIIDKSLVITGENFPVLDARFADEAVTILANQVTFRGFIVKNSKTGSMRDYAAIRLFNVRHVTISHNRLVNNFFGIYLANSKNCTVTNNDIIGTNNRQNSGNGIHLWQCDSILIRDNRVSEHRDGIYFEFARHSLIEHNYSEKNLRYGLHFMFSDNDIYRHNTFKNNGSGVAVMYTKHITMFNNLFIENWGSSVYGLLLKDISDSRIMNNRFVGNTTAVYMEGSDRIVVTGNNFIRNGWAIRVLANCNGNRFMKNNFMANSFDVTTNGSINLNHFADNYWDKYEGYDLNKDGIGDIPYHPVSLYAQVIEQIPQSVMLMRSFIVNLLDKVERSIPSVTPESVKDEKPRMKPNY
ncbi:nitrous oxide reductase family maturation protein NosD [Pedobacter sp. BS3]|uniref:nitrous oxide reductase family maturation protein NosD n=1 Tax=Pedobacter sp. BS3 TaxID=2567937 RepID=UPI001F5BFAA0|nr:nitrous oxide reductase family maturation protein NosD [Pedobacter sp. BS3]